MTTTKKPATKKLTATAKVKLMSALLLDLQKAEFHFPDSDFMEYCTCGCSPYNVPQHKPGCLTVRVHEVLQTCGVKDKPYLR